VRHFHKQTIVALACLLAGGAAIATPVNLVQNGSFESGLAGWAVGGVQGAYPVGAIFYNSATQYPTGAFGEAVGPANSTTLSPDAAGTRAAYFVDDAAVGVNLSQTVFLTAGNYRIGFDAYAPANGYKNPFDASFVAQIAGTTLADYMVSEGPATTWVNYSGLASIAVDGNYLVSFVFDTPGQGSAKDIVLDRVFVLATDEGGGTPISIPEPGTWALLGLGLAGMAAVRKRKNG
jgi:hypothetical protein